jgi:hypothetical protein
VGRPNTNWGLQVSLFKNQVVFTIHWDDCENAAIYAVALAKEITELTGLGYYGAQSGEVIA